MFITLYISFFHGFKKFLNDFFYDRRGSNNSLTLSLNTTKKKQQLQITNSSKECTTLDFLSKQSRLLTIEEIIEVSKCNNNLDNEFYVSYIICSE